MNHATLLKRGAGHLRQLGCRVVLTEARAALNGEHPDVIGWLPGGESIVIEAKSSRKDFRDDWRPDRKAFRHEPERGMGVRRYYITTCGVIAPSDVEPRGWGLIIAYPGLTRVEAESPEHRRNADAELRLIVRCAENSDVTEQLTLW